MTENFWITFVVALTLAWQCVIQTNNYHRGRSVNGILLVIHIICLVIVVNATTSSNAPAASTTANTDQLSIQTEGEE